MSSLRQRALSYVTFAVAGVSFALPGALMPWLLAQWHLQDAEAGLLLFLFSAGTTIGALASRGSLRSSIVRGTICSAAGAVLLAFASRDGAYAVVLLYGFGLGCTITSISLLQSRRFPNDCAAEMTRLNLLWAAGACAGPWIVMHDGLRNGIAERRALLAIAAAFCLFAMGTFFEHDTPPVEQAPRTSRMGLLAVPFSLLLMVFCATGIESAAGGWLATYSQRSGHSLGITIGAPTCLWAGLLLSRALHSDSNIGRAARRFLLTWDLVAMVGAVLSLILFQRGVPLLMAAFVLGFSAGPLYPMLLSRVFRHDTGNMIFVVAGIGAASLPLLTGWLSTATGSLRIALVVPAAAAVAMAITGWFTWRSLQPAPGPLSPHCVE